MAIAQGCECGKGLANMGTPNCIVSPKVLYKFLLGEYLNDVSKPRFIDISITDGETALAADFFDDLINAEDPHERLFPTPPVENFTPETADNENYTTSNGNITKVRDGIKTYNFDIIDGANPTLYGKMKTLECKRLGFFGIDTDGNMSGDGSEVYENDHFKLIPIQKGSFSVKEMDATDTTPYMIHVTFSIPAAFNRGSVKVLEGTAAGTDLTELTGLIDVTGTVVGTPTTTTATVDLAFDYGTATAAEMFEGGVVGDFVLTEVEPTPSTLTITSVTETQDGRYEIVYPAQTSGDILELTMVKNGFALEPVTISIP